MLIDQIKSESLSARRSKLASSGVLTTLLGELATKEKTFNPARALTDEEIVAVIKKFIKNLDEALVAVERLAPERRGAERDKLMAEKAALEGFLPQQIGEAEIEAVARREVSAGATLGGVMSVLKTQYAGRYDGKLASEIVKRVISET